jgi:PAS domain S-box-containing protein
MQLETADELRALLATTSDVITVLGGDGTIHYQTPSAEEVLGYEQASIVGEDAFEYVHPDDRKEAGRLFAEMVESPGRTTDSVEMRFRHADGHWLWVESRGRSLPEDSPLDGDAVITTRDITERVRQREQLERENERLDQFTSVVSHDLRNPLNVLRDSLELMGGVESEHHERCVRAVDRMDALIDDLLAAARHGDADTDPTTLRIGDVARRAWETVATGEAELVVEDGGRIEADPGQCRRLFENLFRNSVEHGSDGEESAVTVRVGFTADGFYVADDGDGFGDVEEERLFEPGYSSAERGTGFGLKIVEEIAESHGWEVEPGDSDTGGTRFDIEGPNRP